MSWRGKAVLAGAALGAALFAAPDAGEAPPASVLVVTSSGGEPYAQAAGVVCSRLFILGHAARVVALDALSEGWERELRGVVGVGPEAALWLQKNRPRPLALCYCMVAHPEFTALGDDPEAAGVSTDVPVGAQFRLIAEALPRVRSMCMLCRSDTEKGRATLAEARKNLPPDWRLHAVPVEKYSSVALAIDALLEADADLVWTASDSSIYEAATVRCLLLEALKRRKPVFGFSPSMVGAGALLGTGIDPAAQGAQAAGLAHRLLAPGQGTVPRGVHAPERFQIAVNLTVAERLSLELPESVVKRACRVHGREKEAGR